MAPPPKWYDSSLNLEYLGSKQKYKFRCKNNNCNNIFTSSWTNVRKNYDNCNCCPKCKIKPHPKWYNPKINEEYLGATKSYNFICNNCGEVFHVKNANRLSNYTEYCPSCKINKPEWYDPTINDGYLGSTKKYNFRCTCGNIINTTHQNKIKNNLNSCNLCKAPPAWFSTCEDEIYLGATEKYNFRCSCGNIFKSTYSDRIKNHLNDCVVCKEKQIPKWYNPEINEEYLGSTHYYNFVCKNNDCNNIYNSNSLFYITNGLCTECNSPEWYSSEINDEYIGAKEEYNFKCSCGNVFASKFDSRKDILCTLCKAPYISKLEQEMKYYLNSLGIEYIHSDWDTIKPQELDFYLPKHNLAIEMNGVYWHSEKFKERNYHLNKTKQCEELGVNLLHITDADWFNSQKQNIIKSMIRGKLKLNSRIFARKTKVVEVPLKQAQEFINSNHLQGYAGARYKLGLEYKGELVACMTFSKARYSSDECYEIIRFASKLNTNVIGGFSKLLKHFQRNFNLGALPILSYADRSHSVGKVYEANGFRFSHYSNPGYKYFHNNNTLVLESREKYMKHKLPKLLNKFNVELTEYENMKVNNYERIWDCGNSVWVLS